MPDDSNTVPHMHVDPMLCPVCRPKLLEGRAGFAAYEQPASTSELSRIMESAGRERGRVVYPPLADVMIDPRAPEPPAGSIRITLVTNNINGVTCHLETNGLPYEEVRRQIVKFVETLQWQLDEETRCPFNVKGS